MKKTAVIIIILELLVIAAGNFLCIRSENAGPDNSYRVEVKRLAEAMRQHETIDSANYPHLGTVTPFNPGESVEGSYIVEEIEGQLYRIEYRQEKKHTEFIWMNIAFGLMLLITIGLIWFVGRKVIRPFAAMEKMAEDLAKGNLAAPVREEKSHLFGRFLWGMDRLREQLEEGRERERAYQKERKTLLLSLSHDIKTPLSAIELYEKALSSGLYDTPGKQAEAYAGIHKNAEELRRYIDEITAASREDFLVLSVKDGAFYLEEVITEIRDYYTEKFAALHTKFTMGSYENLLLKGDSDRLAEVCQNLLENAIKYGDGKEVSITFSEEEDVQLIHVHNTGESPPEEERVHLFDSFYRGSNVGEKPGSGLGLYISRELMKRMDGDIYVTAEEDGFTAVMVARKA